MGQSLATKVRGTMNKVRSNGESVSGYNFSTTYMLNRFLKVICFSPCLLSSRTLYACLISLIVIQYVICLCYVHPVQSKPNLASSLLLPQD